MDSKKRVTFKKPGHKPGKPKESRYAHQGDEVAHIAIDDSSRAGFAEILPDEQKETAISFLQATLNPMQNKVLASFASSQTMVPPTDQKPSKVLVLNAITKLPFPESMEIGYCKTIRRFVLGVVP